MKEPPAFSHQRASQEELARIFNTAIVATKVEASRDYSSELLAAMESPGFKAILSAIKTLSATEGLSERKAAESVIAAFRKVDRLWGDYVLHEGIDRLKGPSQS